jgi:hypothetical protein
MHPCSRCGGPKSKRKGGWCTSCQTARQRERRALRRQGLTPKRVTNCLECGADITYKKANAKFCTEACQLKRWRRENPYDHRPYRIKAKYGIPAAAIIEMYEAQGGCCAICRTPISAPAVRQQNIDCSANIDHCHISGDVRGILCRSCNNGLGCFKDNIESLEAAIAYLKK